MKGILTRSGPSVNEKVKKMFCGVPSGFVAGRGDPAPGEPGRKRRCRGAALSLLSCGVAVWPRVPTTSPHGIERLVKAAAQGAGAPEPTVAIDPGQFTPSLSNDSGLVRKLVPVLRETVGADNVQGRPMSMGGEDFSVFVREGIPGFYYHLGTAEPEAVAAARREAGKPLPTTHSDLYCPVPEPTIKTGVLTMSTLVLHLLSAGD